MNGTEVSCPALDRGQMPFSKDRFLPFLPKTPFPHHPISSPNDLFFSGFFFSLPDLSARDVFHFFASDLFYL